MVLPSLEQVVERFSSSKAEKLLAFCQDLLDAPFRAVGPRTTDRVLQEIVIDSLAPLWSGCLDKDSDQLIVDIGCGAGIPCLPLSMVMDKATFVGVDSIAKKIDFCRRMIEKHSLTNIKFFRHRIEHRTKNEWSWIRKKQPAIVIARAFADPVETLKCVELLAAASTRSLIYTTNDSYEKAMASQSPALNRWKISTIPYKRPENDREYVIMVASLA